MDGLEASEVTSLKVLGDASTSGYYQVVVKALPKSGGGFFDALKTGLKALGSGIVRTGEQVLVFSAGVINSMVSDNLGGQGSVQGIPGIRTDLQVAYGVGKIGGHVVTLLQSATELTAAGGGEVLTLGFGTIPAAAVGSHAIALGGVAIYHLANDRMIIYANGEGDGGGNSTNEPKKVEDPPQETPKSVDDILQGTSPGRETKGRAKQYEKDGGATQANKDFDDLKPTDVKNIDGGRVGTLPNGKKINVRTNSSDGRPTLEIQDGKKSIKIRYNEKK